MLTWQDVLYYVRLFWRWWFVIALSVALAAGTAWYMTRQQPDVFFSQATLRVGNNFEVSAPSEQQVSLSNVLADYYAALVKREVILGPVAERLQLSFPWPVIRDRMLMTRIDRGANLLEIKITDTNPDRAAAIANAIADQLIAYTPNAPDKVAAQQAEVSRQLQETQGNIQAVEAKIGELESRLTNLSSAIDISDVQTQLDALQRTRQRYLDEYASLINLSNQSSVNSLTVFEQARPALYPLPKKRSLTLAIAGAGGLLMAIVAILILDRLDERWRTGSELLSRTGIPSLGDVPIGPPGRPEPQPGGLARHQALNNAFSNMIVAAKSTLPRTLLVSSPQTSLGRSALAVDIAELYARTGHRVLLIDTESHLSSMAGLLGEGDRPSHARSEPGGGFDGPGNIWSYVRSTPIANLLVLSGRDSGYDRFSSLVPLGMWPEMVGQLRKSADVVIFDGPAALTGPEASLLAPNVDGVLMVLNGRQDTRSTAIKSRKRLASETEIKFLGAIVVSQTGRTQRGGASAKNAKFRVAFGRDGITISLGEQKSAAAANGNSAAAPRLLSAPEAQAEVVLTTSPSVATTGPAHNKDEHVTWEDLLTLEVGGAQPVRAESGPTQAINGGARHGTYYGASEFVPPFAPPMGVIITPPPATSSPPTSLGEPQSRAARPERQRRPRIANSRRNSRTGRPASGADNGSESA